MKKNRRTYTFFHKCSALFMIMALLWLTVSTPFVFSFKQAQVKQQLADTRSPASDCEDSNPLGSNTEEKVPNPGNSVTEEYLHDQHIIHPQIAAASQYHKCENASDYIAYHGELLVPPPNVA